MSNKKLRQCLVKIVTLWSSIYEEPGEGICILGTDQSDFPFGVLAPRPESVAHPSAEDYLAEPFSIVCFILATPLRAFPTL